MVPRTPSPPSTRSLPTRPSPTTSSAYVAIRLAVRVFTVSLQWTLFPNNVGIGTRIGIKRIMIYTAPNVGPFATATADSSVYLNQMSTITEIADSCLGHALTNQEFTGGILGLANVGTICSPPSTVGTNINGITVYSRNTAISTVNLFGGPAPLLQSMLVFTHETGHNFGMFHDNDCSPYCKANSGLCQSDGLTINSSPGGNYIMWPISVAGSDNNNRVFSACSLYFGGQVRAFLRSRQGVLTWQRRPSRAHQVPAVFASRRALPRAAMALSSTASTATVARPPVWLAKTISAKANLMALVGLRHGRSVLQP